MGRPRAFIFMWAGHNFLGLQALISNTTTTFIAMKKWEQNWGGYNLVWTLGKCCLEVVYSLGKVHVLATYAVHILCLLSDYYIF